MERFLYYLATDRHRGGVFVPIKIILLLLSLIYGAAVRMLIFFARRSACRLDSKVVSIGNITVGGTGKTALVEFVARYLRSQGHQVAILSRGYKRRVSHNGTGTGYELMGDEPYMLQMRLSGIPVVVDKDRVEGARRAWQTFGADTVVLDDGFQQWKITKDLEIVTIDATRPFGNGHLLPRGILREPLSSLKRADIFVLTKTNLQAETGPIKDLLSRLNPRAAIFESGHQPAGFFEMNASDQLLSLESLKSKTVTLFSGIGDPDSFERLVQSLDIQIGLSYRFNDHHDFTRQDLEAIFDASRSRHIDTLITTEKDFARLKSMKADFSGLRVLVLRIELIVKDEQRFCHRLLELYPA